MKTRDVAALVLIVFLVLYRISGETLQIMAVSWGIDSQWTGTAIDRVFWMVRIFPYIAIHVGCAVWLRNNAATEARRFSSPWPLFGLCFGPVAVLTYLAIKIFRYLVIQTGEKAVNPV